MIFSRAAQQFDEAAEHYEQAGVRLDAVAARAEDCLRAVFAGRDQLQWDSPAGQAFTAVTFHHVEGTRGRQSRVAEMAAAARMIAADLRVQAQLARVLAAAAATVPAAGADLGAHVLLDAVRAASESAEDFLRFLQSHGGLPLARLAAAQG